MAAEWGAIPPWWVPNLIEPPVLIALRDLCQPGAVVFDVGANVAGLTVAMSRAVGPRGAVCAFEASPRVIEPAQRNLVVNGCSNVQLYHAAVYHTTGLRLPFFYGSHSGADSLFPPSPADKNAALVPTLALDDFVMRTGLHPTTVKMDIEGAEHDALRGFQRTIASDRPHLVLETFPSDPRSQACYEFLIGQGYVAYDLNTYKVVTNARDYPAGVEIRNTLYVHESRRSETPYVGDFSRRPLHSFDQRDFAPTDAATRETLRIPLAAGRYLIDARFEAKGSDNEMWCGVKDREHLLFRYWAHSSLLAGSYRDWVLDLGEDRDVSIFFRFLRDTRDDTLVIHGATVMQLPAFSDRSRALQFF